MQDVVQEKTIYIQTDGTDMHFLVLDAYRTLLSDVLKHQESIPTGAVLLTGQPDTGSSVFLKSVVPAFIDCPPGKTT